MDDRVELELEVRELLSNQRYNFLLASKSFEYSRHRLPVEAWIGLQHSFDSFLEQGRNFSPLETLLVTVEKLAKKLWKVIDVFLRLN